MRSLIRRRTAALDLPREVWVLAAVAFSVALGFGIVAPVIPVFARKFGVGQTAAGLVISAFAFMRLAFGPTAGAIVNRLGERLVMAVGIGIVAVSSLLTGLAGNYTQMLALRAVGGVGSVMFTVSAQSLLLGAVHSSQRARASSMYRGGFLLGGLTGPALGGVLGGISLRLPFFIYAGTLGLAGAIALAQLRRPGALADTKTLDATPPAKLWPTLRNPAYQAALTVNAAVGWAIFGVRSSLVPLFVVEVLHRGTLWTGLGLLASSLADVATLYPAGRLADSTGRRPMLLIGSACGCVATGLLAVSHNLPAYLFSMVLYGVTSSFLSASPAAVVGDVVGGRAGTVVAVFGMTSDLGAVVGPLVTGALAQHISYGAAFGSTSAVLGLGLLMSLRMPETLRRDSTQRERQVGDQVLDVLDADREPHKVVWDL